MKTEALTPELREETDGVLRKAQDALIEAIKALVRDCCDNDMLRATEQGLRHKAEPTKATIGCMQVTLTAEAARALVQEEINRRFDEKMAALQTFAAVAQALGNSELEALLLRAYNLNVRHVYEDDSSYFRIRQAGTQIFSAAGDVNLPSAEVDPNA